MKISINSVHFKADQKLEDFINEKVNKLASTYEEIIGGDITVRLDNSSSNYGDPVKSTRKRPFCKKTMQVF